MRVLRRSFTPNKEILKFTCQRRKCEYDLRGSGCDVTFVLFSQRKGTRVNVSGHARRRTLHHRLRALGFCSTTRRTDLRLCKFTRKRNWLLIYVCWKPGFSTRSCYQVNGTRLPTTRGNKVLFPFVFLLRYISLLVLLLSLLEHNFKIHPLFS